MKRLIGVIVLLAFLSAAIFWLASLDIATIARSEKKTFQNSAEKNVQDAQSSMLLGSSPDALKQISRKYQDISVKAVPSVVHIRSIQGPAEQSVVLQSAAISDYYTQLGIDAELEGTGVFINDQGLILTPLHVVLGAVAVQVRTWDGQTYSAELVSADAGTDLAILKIPASGTRAIKWGDSSTLGLGESLVLVGADSQMNGRICQGIVSSSPRTPQVLDEGYFGQYFLIDASSLSPRSGWLVLNLDGLAVGILGQSPARIYRSQGECVAFVSNQVHQISDLLAEGSLVQRSFVGLHLQQLTPDLAAAQKLKSANGALVSDIVPGSPAEVAGLLPGDVILKLNSQSISNYGQVRTLVSSLPTGKPVNIEFDRKGALMSLPVTPVAHPMQVVASRNEALQMRGPSAVAEISLLDALGVEEVAELPIVPKGAVQPKRVVIRTVDYQQVIPSFPLEAGIQILEIDGQKISTKADFEAIKAALPGHATLSLRIQTMGTKRYLTLKPVQ